MAPGVFQRGVTAGVSAESAGVCKTPSVICGLGLHGLDFKRCLARLTPASSHTGAPRKRGLAVGAPSAGSRSPRVCVCVGAGVTWTTCVLSPTSAGSRDLREWPDGLRRLARIRCWAHTRWLPASVGWGGGGGETHEGAFSRGGLPGRELGPAAQTFKTS